MKTALVTLGALAIVAATAHAQAAPADSAALAVSTSLAEYAPVAVTLSSDAPQDTVRRRAKAVEVSDAYELRLRIHRYASYTMIPLFIVQSVAGNQLYQADNSGAQRPSWASNTHSLGAAAIGALFTINTVTGLWNLWESRGNDVGRTKRLLHSGLLLASDAGFAWSGIKLASDAKHNSSSRTQHKNVAYYSMGAALVGYGIMLVGDH
ncbi:MAG: hypothetical protein ABJA80_04430 [bacterium]